MNNLLKKPYFKLATILVVLLIVIASVRFYIHRRNLGSGTIPSTPTAQASTPVNSDKQVGSPVQENTPAPASSDKTKDNPTPSPDSTSSPLAPFGTFISNHKPNLGGSPAPSQEQSVCNTTPGATCYIQFTKAGIIKTLGSQKTDNNGSTVWNWDINKAGFSAGSWEVTAFATLNGQTATTKDPLALEVQP